MIKKGIGSRVRDPAMEQLSNFGSPQTLISAKKLFFSAKMPSSFYGTPLAVFINGPFFTDFSLLTDHF